MKNTRTETHRNTRNTLEHKGITNKSEETRRDNKSKQQIRNPKSETMEAVAAKLCCVFLHRVLPSQERQRQRRWSSVVFFFILFFRGFLFFVVRSLHSSGLFVSVLTAFFRFCVSSSPTKIEFVRLCFCFLELESYRLEIYVELQAQSAIHNKCKASF